MKKIKVLIKLVVFACLFSQNTNAMLVPAGNTQVVPAQPICLLQNSCVPICQNSNFDYIDQEELTVGSQIAQLLPEVDCNTSKLEILKKVSQDSTLKKELENLGFSVRVPEFITISDSTMKSFLASAGLDLDIQWQEVLENSNMTNVKKIQETLRSQTLPEAFIEELRNFGQTLIDHFEFLAKAEEQKECAHFFSFSRIASWFSQKPFFSQEIENFVAIAQKNNWRLAINNYDESISNIIPQKSEIIRAIRQVLQSYISNQPKYFKQQNSVKFFDNFFSSISIHVMTGENFEIKRIPKQFQSNFINAAKLISDYVQKFYNLKIAPEFFYQFFTFTYGEKLVKCKPIQSLEGKDFEPDSEYLRSCNGAIQKQEDNVYFVANPISDEDKKLMDQSSFDICHENTDSTTCYSLHNNQAGTACKFTANETSVACTQFTLTDHPKKEYVIKSSDGQIYSENGEQLTFLEILPEEAKVAQEYFNLLRNSAMNNNSYSDMKITQDSAPTLYNLVKKVWRKFPILRKKNFSFFLNHSSEIQASSFFNTISISIGLMNRVLTNPGTLKYLIEILNHEISHSLQNAKGALSEIEIDLQGDSQKDGFVKLENCETNADKLGAFAGSSDLYSSAASLFYLEATRLACQQDLKYENLSVNVCNQKYNFPSYEINYDEIRQRMGFFGLSSQLRHFHPEIIKTRIPALLEVAETKASVSKLLNQFIVTLQEHPKNLNNDQNLLLDTLFQYVFDNNSNEFLLNNNFKEKLFNVLIQKRYMPALKATMVLAESLSHSRTTDDVLELINMSNACKLLEALISQDYEPALLYATNLAESLMLTTSTFYHDDGLKLFKVLIQQGYKPALESATNLINSHEISQLCRYLVEKGYKPAVEVVKTLAKSLMKNDPSLSGDLFQMLVEQGYKDVFEDATILATSLVQSTSFVDCFVGRALFKALFTQKNTPALEEAKRLVNQINDPYDKGKLQELIDQYQV